MTPESDVIKLLRAKDEDLRRSRHDPQAGVLELVEQAHSLRHSTTEDFISLLITLIEANDSQLSDFAIEFLLRDESGRGAQRLHELAASAQQSEVWFRPVLAGLVRAGHRPSTDLAKRYITTHWREPEFPAVAIAQMAPLDGDFAVQIGAAVLTQRLPSAHHSAVESWSQIFVNGFLRRDEESLVSLVRSIVDHDSRRRFIAATVATLRSPWMIQRHGHSAIAGLAGKIEEASD